MKDLVAEQPSPSNIDKLNMSILSTESTGASGDGVLGSSRRRSSTGTYSSAEDDDDNDGEHRRVRDDEQTRAALSEDETNDEKCYQGNHDDLFLKISNTAKCGEDDEKLMTDSSLVGEKIDSSRDQEERESPRIEEPRVDFTKGNS